MENLEIKNKTKKSNVITFKKESNFLTESEINSLFLGFVNLIKRNVVFEKEKEYKAQINNYLNQIKEFLNIIDEKNKEILDLKQKLAELNKSV